MSPQVRPVNLVSQVLDLYFEEAVIYSMGNQRTQTEIHCHFGLLNMKYIQNKVFYHHFI